VSDWIVGFARALGTLWIDFRYPFADLTNVVYLSLGTISCSFGSASAFVWRRGNVVSGQASRLEGEKDCGSPVHRTRHLML
jgi:hypothetical protein